MLTGNGAVDTSTHRLLGAVRDELSARRLERLVEAVREHELRAGRTATARRPHDDALYVRLREIVGGSAR
jgi:hypothetical protein